MNSIMKVLGSVCGLGLVSLALLCGLRVDAVPVVDGSINPGSEGWTLLTEAQYARPVYGGEAGASDRTAETSTYHWWDDGAGADRSFSTDNRGDVINVYATYDDDYLYVAVAGPTVPFNDWSDPNVGASGDQGDLFVALDTAGGVAGGGLPVTNGHSGWGGERAVDFLNWRPTYALGLQYADNGGGGGGWANLEQTGLLHVEIAGASQGVSDDGFLWNAAVNGSASYDAGGHAGAGFAGEFEFRVPWTQLGFSQRPDADHPLRLMAYTTQNFTGSDLYDSGPGFGNGTDHEEVGDCPGDPDDPSYISGGVTGTLYAADGLGDDAPPDDGAVNGSYPGANVVGDRSFQPGTLDGVDTIQEYYVYAVPEPTTGLLMLIGWLAMGARRRRSRSAA